MPTNAVTFAADEIDMRWKEPYLTEGLNEKAMIFPRGVYRGFNVTTNGVALTVTVAAASPKNDHLAAVETQNSYSLTIRRDTGPFNINLTAYASTTVVIAIYATYSVGVTTAAFVTVYTQAEYNALTAAGQNELTVLATVIVPAAGVIPAANISTAIKTYPWANASLDSFPWIDVVQNGGFELGRTNTGEVGAIPYWSTLNSSSEFRTLTTDPDTGTKAIGYRHNTTGTSNGTLEQFLGTPVEVGQRGRFTFRMKRVVAATASASPDLTVEGYDTTGAVISVISIAPMVLTTTDGAYVTYSTDFVVPATTCALYRVLFDFSAVQYGTSGTVLFYIDNVSVLMQPTRTTTRDRARSHGADVECGSLYIRHYEGSFTAWDDFISFMYGPPDVTGPSEGAFVGRHRTASTTHPAFYWYGRLRVGEGNIDTAAKARAPRVELPFSSTNTPTQIVQSAPFPTSASQSTFRAYAGNNHRHILTQNGSWDGTNWVKDVSGTGFSLYDVTAAGITYSHRLSTDNVSAPTAKNIYFVDGENRTLYWDVPEVLGNGMVGSTTEANRARTTITKRTGTGTGAMTRVLHIDTDSDSLYSEYVTAYAGGSGDAIRYYYVQNGSWNPSTNEWEAVVQDYVVSRLVVDSRWSFEVGSFDVASGLFDDIPFAATDVRGVVINPDNFEDDTTDFDPGYAYITQLNVPKTLGTVVTGGGSPVATHLYGATVSYNGTKVRVTYDSAILPASEDQEVVVPHLQLNSGNPLYQVVIDPKTNTYFDIRVYDNTGTQVDLTANAHEIAWVSFGYHS